MCQDLCTDDVSCKGYMRYSDPKLRGCSIATDSECPEGCFEPVNEGNVGPLNLDTRCSSGMSKEDYKEGCIIKKKGSRKRWHKSLKEKHVIEIALGWIIFPEYIYFL